MALTAIGFSGLPVAGGAGMKAPLFKDPADGSFFMSDAPQERWPRNMLDEFAEQRLVSLFARELPCEASSRVVYAHEDFVKPKQEGAPRVHLGGLSIEPRLESFVALVSPTEATQLFRGWAGSLVARGSEIFRLGDVGSAEIAFGAALRARFCTVMHELAAEREEACALARASLLAAGRDVAPFDTDLELEFDPLAIKRIGDQAQALLASRLPRPTPWPLRLKDALAFIGSASWPREATL